MICSRNNQNQEFALESLPFLNLERKSGMLEVLIGRKSGGSFPSGGSAIFKVVFVSPFFTIKDTK